jgi:hypothetical protein
MPFIGGRFYINPAHGRALEPARAAEGESEYSGPHDRGPSEH